MSNAIHNITKKFLEEKLAEGKTSREIAEIIGCSKSNVGHFITKFGLNNMQIKSKLPPYKINKIDSIEKAYALGFICCDGAVEQDGTVEISIEKSDREIVDYIAPNINGRVFEDNTYCKETKRFPRARLNKKIPDIKTFIGGPSKADRHFPITNEGLIRYALLGAFDADGCITWGRRKDRNRMWHKVSFTTSLSIAVCIQNILIKYVGISTIVRPKSNHEKCCVIEFANKDDILKFFHYIYCDDFVVLKRKYLKYNALRLELEENGESAA